ncbi:choice-of-anchor J domain-containing protein, partial [Bacteroidota bacterium]|nr:choice-of-anchor J domain-containing protein [Bacteroidota bacterium]
EIDLTGALDEVQLSFWMHGYGNTMGTLNVSVVRPGTDTTVVFTSSGQTHATGSMPWWNIGVDLSTYIGETVKLAFTQIDDQDYTLHSSAAFRGDMSIDLVQVTTCAACSAPGTISASNLTSTSADISWVAGGSETAWNFEYGATGYTLGSGTSSIVSTNPTTSLTGLTANTSYDVYVQSDCGGATGTSVWAGPFTFTTPCAPISNFPFNMNFALSEWQCWSNSGTWYYFATNGTNSDTAAGLINNVVHDDHFISPEFTVTDLVSDRFSLMSSGFGSVEYYEILVSTTASTNVADFLDTVATDVTTLDVAQFSYDQFDLSAYEGQSIRLAIHAYSPLGASWYHLFDDVRIDGYVSDTVNQTVIACDSYTWSVDDSTYNVSGTYTLNLPAQDTTDSDSTMILNLTINNSDASSETVTACNSYTWSGDGNTYNATGNYVAVLQTVDGCDSTATLVLTINSSDVVNLSETACDSYDWNGSTYTTSGNQTFTTTNAAGCDSVVNLVLTINNSSGASTSTSSCNSYVWNGTTYSSSGVYIDTLVNSNGCPQIDTLDLTITTSSTSLTQSSCDSFTWNGTPYTTSGTYYNASGSCVDTLYLTINSSNTSVTDLVSCDSLFWNGLNYLTSGTYTYTTTNSVGCDSVATLNLTINNSENNSLSVTECDHYIWNGDTLTSSGVYVDTLQTTNSCDSVVTVNLTINNSSIDTVNVFACEDYTWNGVTYTTSGDYTDTLTSITGCDSIVTLSLDVNVTNAPYSESFDTGFPGCWSQELVNDILDWSLNTGPTGSSGTGPSDDITGGGNYMYIEASSPAAYSDIAIMYSDNIDISSLTNPEMRFFSHMYGSATGSLYVDMWDGSVYTNVFTKSGNQGNQWNEEKVLLSTSSSIVSFRIWAVLDSNASGLVWPGDIAIDEFGVREALANDLALVAAVAPSGCDLTSNEPIEIWVVNQGINAESNFDVSYGVNGAAPTIETIAGPLAAGDTIMYVFTATADMSADGMYNIASHVYLSTDSDTLDNNILFDGENLVTPAAPTTMGDTVCNGDTAMI